MHLTIAVRNDLTTDSEVREFRDGMLLEADDWASPETAEQTAYRQALRDITDQSGFPTNITWPTKP